MSTKQGIHTLSLMAENKYVCQMSNIYDITLYYHNVITLWYIKFKGLDYINCLQIHICVQFQIKFKGLN